MSRAVLVLLVAAAVGLCLAWPRVSVVDTGHPVGASAYPELQPREYAAGEDAVARAAKSAVVSLPGWSWVGGGSGAGGSALQARSPGTVPMLASDVTIRIRPQAGHARVEVRTQARTLPWDFGEGARTIRAFYAELDGKMAGVRRDKP